MLDATDTVQSEAGDTGEMGEPADLRGVCTGGTPSSPGTDPDSAENCDVSVREVRFLFTRPVGGP